MTAIRHEARVPLTAAGRRFDQTLAELFPDYSRSRLSAWIKSGAAMLDGAMVPPRHLLRGGELVRLEAELLQEVLDHLEEEALEETVRITEELEAQEANLVRAKVQAAQGVEALILLGRRGSEEVTVLEARGVDLLLEELEVLELRELLF